MDKIKAYLLLGSNLAQRLELLRKAVNDLALTNNIEVLRVSNIYETEPWGIKNQNDFLNMAVEIETSLSEQELLVECQKIETALGRNREKETRWGARPIDIDIIFYGEKVIRLENLTIPHIYMQERAFVLVPLMELIPNFVHPILNKTVSQIYNELEKNEKVVLYNSKEVTL